jgi:hypothetical protein
VLLCCRSFHPRALKRGDLAAISREEPQPRHERNLADHTSGGQRSVKAGSGRPRRVAHSPACGERGTRRREERPDRGQVGKGPGAGTRRPGGTASAATHPPRGRREDGKGRPEGAARPPAPPFPDAPAGLLSPVPAGLAGPGAWCADPPGGTASPHIRRCVRWQNAAMPPEG